MKLSASNSILLPHCLSDTTQVASARRDTGRRAAVEPVAASQLSTPRQTPTFRWVWD